MPQSFDYKIPTYFYRNSLLKELKSIYPFINIHILGKSLCKRNIHCIQIGNKNNMVLLAGAFHGMEWLTSLLLLHFTKNLCHSIKNHFPLYNMDINKFFKYFGVFIIPCVNPDGVEISISGAKSANQFENLITNLIGENTIYWQANARGVDLNHNFNAGWNKLHSLEIKNGITGPASTRYGSSKPETEPEVKAITNICKKLNFRHAIAFHSQGEEIYWDFGCNTPIKSQLIASIMSMCSGYKISKPDGLAVGGGFKDWFILKFKKPAFTIEIGKGQNPLPLSDLPQIYNRLEQLLVLTLFL